MEQHFGDTRVEHHTSRQRPLPSRKAEHCFKLRRSRPGHVRPGVFIKHKFPCSGRRSPFLLGLDDVFEPSRRNPPCPGNRRGPAVLRCGLSHRIFPAIGHPFFPAAAGLGFFAIATFNGTQLFFDLGDKPGVVTAKFFTLLILLIGLSVSGALW